MTTDKLNRGIQKNKQRHEENKQGHAKNKQDNGESKQYRTNKFTGPRKNET